MRQVIVLSALLGVAMTGSYLQWTADESGPTAGDEAVAMYTASASDLSKLVWDSEELTLVLSRKSDDKGEYTWVEVTERKEVLPEPEPEEEEEASDTGADDDTGAEAEPEEEEPPPEPVIEETNIAFKGNASAEDLWDKFAPLYALRKLDSADANSTAFGLDEPDASIQIERRSGAVEVAVGAESYGTKNRYVRYGDAVYLLDDATLRPLQFGKTRLVERNVVPLKSNAVDGVLVAAGEQKVEFVHKNKDDPAAAYWARKDTPDDADDTAGTWIDKLFRLRVAEYADAEIEPTLEPVLTYILREGSETWQVDLLREKGAISPEYYARSQHNRAIVKLTKGAAGEVVADLDTVLEAGEAEE